MMDHNDDDDIDTADGRLTRRRHFLSSAATALTLSWLFFPTRPPPALAVKPTTHPKKCTDIDSCRELGEQKQAQDDQLNPVVQLGSGVRYKVLRPAVGTDAVQDGSIVELAYSINANGGYLYSQGMGYEKVAGQNDLGIDSIRIVVGNHNVPTGIEEALIGMRRGERRRIELPPQVGFVTSNWEPKPNNPVAQQRVDAYRRILEGGFNQPPFPMVSIWDVQVERVRS